MSQTESQVHYFERIFLMYLLVGTFTKTVHSPLSFFSCLSSIVERGERAVSELDASAKQDVRESGVRSLCSSTFSPFLALKNREAMNSLIPHLHQS